MTSTPIESILGGLFVLLHAFSRFNRPPTNRTSTTAARYWVATLSYSGLLVGFYVLLVVALVRMQFFTDNLGGAAAQLSTPLLAALLMTILLPTLPLLKELDEWSRSWLQNIALIPHEARRLSAEMRRASFSATPALQQRVREEFLQQGFDPTVAVFIETGSPEYIWTKVTTLLLQIRDWESDRRFSAFVTAFGEEYGRIRRRYEQLSLKTRRWFGSVRELSMAEDKNTAALARQYQEELLDQCSELHQAVCTFASHGVLKCELTSAARTARLRALGFDLSISHQRLTLNRVMLLLGVVGVILVSGFVTAGALVKGDPMGSILARTAMISIIYSVAVCCAIVPKEWWPSARREADGDRPVAFYFLASVVAAGASLLISSLFWLIMTFKWQEMRFNLPAAFDEWNVRYPWALLSFMTAFAASWLADNRAPSTTQRLSQRTREGLTQAAVALLTSVVVRVWLGQVAPGDPRLPVWPFVLSLSPTVGFVIGFLVPTWYREAPRERVSNPEFDIIPPYRPQTGSVFPGGQ